MDHPEQIEEIAEFGYSNTKQMLPVIVLDDLQLEPDSGMYRFDNVALN